MKAHDKDSERGQSLGEALHSFGRDLGVEPGLIRRLLHECESFREICADYEQCCAKLDSLARRGDTSGGQVRDYLEMRDQLERELLRHLKGADAQRSHGKRVE